MDKTMTDKPTIQIDMADALSKLTPEQVAAFDKMLSGPMLQRLRIAEQAFHAMHRAATPCGGVDPVVRLDTQTGPMGVPMREYIAKMGQVIFHPDQQFVAGQPQLGGAA